MGNLLEVWRARGEVGLLICFCVQGSWEERLASYFAHQIRTDPTSVYGDGFKLALEAYQESDLPTVIAHAERTGRFPGC